MTLRVGLIHYGLDRSATGVGRYTTELTTSLIDQELAIHRLWAGKCPSGMSGESMHGAYLLPGLLTIGQMQISRLSRRLELDIVHDPTGVMPLLLTQVARVVTIHDVIPYIHPQTSTCLDRLIYHVWLPLAVRRASAVITSSKQSRRDIVNYLPVSPDRTATVLAAADGRFRPMQQREIMPILHKYGIDEPYILYVGALESRKNLPRLLEAFALLRDQIQTWCLVIVGPHKWKLSPIYDTVQRLNLEPYVHFTGYVEEEHLPALYNGADLFVFPSLYEGFGLPVLEAMACGTPVITSNTSSLPEVAGDAAVLVDPYDVESIGHAMYAVLTQPALAASMSEKGMKHAAQFTWERTARETIAVYEKVLNQSG